MKKFHQKFTLNYEICKNNFHEKSRHYPNSNFGFNFKHHINYFLSQDIISEEIKQIKTSEELHIFTETLVGFFTQKGAKFTRLDFSRLVITNWQNVDISLLKELLIISNIPPSNIQMHIFPEIRKKVQCYLNQSKFPQMECLYEIRRLHIFLQYCGIKTGSYLEDWFKINHPWEGEESLQNQTAQKNIKILIKSIKK